MRRSLVTALTLLCSPAVAGSALAGQAGSAPAAQTRQLRGDAPPTAQSGTPATERTIELDNTGVGDWNYVNPRRPPKVWDRRNPAPAGFRLVFANTTSGRTIKVALPPVAVPASTELADALLSLDQKITTGAGATRAAKDVGEELFGARLDDCAKGKDKKGEERTICTPTLTIPPNSSKWIAGTLLDEYPANLAIAFRLSFFDETEQPSKALGYFSLDQRLNEPASAANWSAIGILQYARDPFYGPEGDPIDIDHQYSGATTRQFRGTGRASLLYQLGSRATANVDLQFKNNAFGRAGDDLTVRANQFNFTVFGLGGTSLRFGRYDVAAPTDGLAIRESGEGVTVRFRWLALSHLVRRESALGAADPRDDDHKSWIAEANSLNVAGWSALRSLNLIGVYGIDETPSRDRRYFTGGGEAYFGIPKSATTGLLAAYVSRSRPEPGSLAIEARGFTWLARGAHTWFKENKALHTVSITLAHGSGDDPNTERYEGYLGETASYNAESSIYVASVVPRLRLEPVPFTRGPDGTASSTPEFPRRGLNNRTLFGFAASTQLMSPLEWIASALRIPQTDVESRQTTARVLYYAPNERIEGTRDGSMEFQVESQLESPKGVKYSVRASVFRPGGPLESFFPKLPVTLMAQCTVTLR